MFMTAGPDTPDLPDDVPRVDAAYQARDLTSEENGLPEGSTSAPLESNPADWQDQQRVVKGPEEDEQR